MDSKKTILILGAKGMLGQALVHVFGIGEGYDVTAWDCEEIDVTDFTRAEEKIRSVSPNIIVNAVAYNAVDLCETSEEEYMKASILNTSVPEFLARLAKDMNATLVHYSTDYVFDGSKSDGYKENAEPNPISRYGLSKRKGEEGVTAVGEAYYIIRLSKLFGKPATSALGKTSFFEKMLEIAEGKSEVIAVDDERSCFTYAPDLALATRELIEDDAVSGIYHLTNVGAATWYEAATELFRIANPSIRVKPVNGDTFPRPAKRPHCSELINTKRTALRPYTEALREFVKECVL